MAGRRQHYVPQFLQRGFLVDADEEAERTWLHRRSAEARLVGIRDVGVREYFYSKLSTDGSASLDDLITSQERGLDADLASMRSTPAGTEIDPTIAARLTAHLTLRTAHVRSVFQQGVNLVLDQFVETATETGRMREFLGLDGSDRLGLKARIVDEALQMLPLGNLLPPELTQRMLNSLIRESFDEFYKESASAIVQALNNVGEGLTVTIRDSHNKALMTADQSHWQAELSQLRWRVCGVAGAILPDCISLAEDAAGEFTPLLLRERRQVDTVILPLAHDRLLVGSRRDHVNVRVDLINQASAACSDSFFISRQASDGIPACASTTLCGIHPSLAAIYAELRCGPVQGRTLGADRVPNEEAGMVPNAVHELLEALRSDRPAVLLLGQDYMRLDGEDDPVLRAFIQRRTAHAAGTSLLWKEAFQDRPIDEQEYEWLAERFDRSVQSERMERVFDLAWSAVFTSSIDPKIVQRLESRGRVPEPVLAKDHFARASRSRARPAVHFLFGRACDASPDVRPPRTLVELKRRYATHASALLNRLPDTATPLGVVVVDGYDGASDWLELDQLLAPISSVPGPRVLWFGSAGRSIDSVFFAQMEQDGILIRDPRTLAQALLEHGVPAEASQAVFHVDIGTISLADGKFLQLPAPVRLRTEAAAAVVDDTWTDPSPSSSEVPVEESFRRFHGDFGGTRALVEGVGKGYAIARDFEGKLLTSVVSQLARTGELENFVVVHGQSGVGKTIALARLVRELRIRQKIPVLYASGRVPAAVEVDDFCEECERAGAAGTIIVCDAGQSFERYRDLAVGLKSRGRRSVVVGSSYRVEDPKLIADDRFIEASEVLSAAETSQLRDLLLAFGDQEAADLSIEQRGEHFLALLYRHLTVSRTRLAKGVASEARFVEGTIRLRARAVPPGAQTPTRRGSERPEIAKPSVRSTTRSG